METYQKQCEEYFEKTFEVSDKLIQQTKFFEYLEQTIQQKDIQIAKIEHKHDKDIIKLQKNSREGLKILEKKIEFYERNENSKNQIIINLKKEVQILRSESKGVIENISNALGDVKQYHNVHQKLLEKENILIRNIGNEEKKEKNKLRDMLSEFCSDFLKNFDLGISGVSEVSRHLEKQFEALKDVIREMRIFDKIERGMVRKELETAMVALTAVKKIMDQDQKPFGALMEDFRLLYEDFEKEFLRYSSGVEEQYERYKRLCELNRI